MNNFDSNRLVVPVSHIEDLTIVIVTYNRTELLTLLMDSLVAALQIGAHLKTKFIFCINGCDDLSEDFLIRNKNRLNANVEIIKLDVAATPAEARNTATHNVRSPWILFLDDDVEVPPALFENFDILVKKDPQVCLWGGPNLTPKSSSFVQKKIGWFLQDYLVTGPISYRYKLNKVEALECKGTYFSLCNMFVKTDMFRTTLFNGMLKTAEENELIFKLARQGVKMKTSDLLYVWHYRRNSIPHFLQQIKNYGYGRGQLIYNGMVSKSLKYLLLAFATIFVFCAIKLPILLGLALVLWVGSLSLKLAIEFKFKNNIFLDLTLPFRLWISYGTGIVAGYMNSYRINKN